MKTKKLWKHQKYAIEKYKDKEFFGLLFDMGLGKEQPLTSKVLTPNGYVQMKDVYVGMTILDGKGQPCKITGIFPQGVKKTYRINFTDRTYIRVGEEHLNCFELHHRYGKKEVVLTTKELIKGLSKNNKYWCLLPTCTFNSNEEPLIDAYLLGVLLGDGCLCSKGNMFVCLPEEDVKHKVEEKLKLYECELKQVNEYDFVIRKNSKLREILNNYGLLVHSKEKFIPKPYLFSSIENRIALLQGLFDTDGTVQKHKRRSNSGAHCGGGCSFSFSTTSNKLSEDFSFLVRSLGLVDCVTTRDAKYKVNGVVKVTGTDYRHFLKVPNDFNIATSKKHLAKIVPRQNSPMRKVVSVTEDVLEDCQCIMVDSPLHTYITDNVTVTHNTMTSARIAEEKDRPVLIIAPNCLCEQWEKELKDNSEERITNKDWEVLVCTSKTKNTKKFKEEFEKFCKIKD